jgi:decaprenyl-phosphate phosphoribosyltransferase
MTAYIATLRPQQWIKNIFVGAPLVFARHLTEPAYLARSAVAVLAFCLLSGAVYTFNDVRDVEADRAHPTKKNRPVASGRLSERTALIWAAVLATVSLAGCLVLSWQLAAFAAAYLVQNVAYSVRLKHIAFVDVALLASGFLLRVLAGAAAIAVPASGWLLICTALVALFFGFGKRAHELAWAQRMGDVTTTRASLAGYRLPVVHVLMLLLAVLTCLAYVAYTLDEHTIRFFGTDRLVWSAPFVVFGVIRFLFITLYKPTDDNPTEAMLKDWLFLADLAGATATVLYIIYGNTG